MTQSINTVANTYDNTIIRYNTGRLIEEVAVIDEHCTQGEATQLYERADENGTIIFSVVHQHSGVRHYQFVGQRYKIYQPADINTIQCIIKVYNPTIYEIGTDRPSYVSTDNCEIFVFNIKDISRKRGWNIDYEINDNIITIRSATKKPRAPRAKKVPANTELNTTETDTTSIKSPPNELAVATAITAATKQLDKSDPVQFDNAINYNVDKAMLYYFRKMRRQFANALHEVLSETFVTKKQSEQYIDQWMAQYYLNKHKTNDELPDADDSVQNDEVECDNDEEMKAMEPQETPNESENESTEARSEVEQSDNEQDNDEQMGDNESENESVEATSNIDESEENDQDNDEQMGSNDEDDCIENTDDVEQNTTKAINEAHNNDLLEPFTVIN